MSSRAFSLALCIALISCFTRFPIIEAAGMSPSQGVIGSSVTISGLAAQQSFIVKWDGVNIVSGTVPSVGSIIFAVPETVGSNHGVEVQSPAGTQVMSTTFLVLPSITIDPIKANSGATVSVSGKGFAASEGSIQITFDVTNVKSGITASSLGSWSTTFNVPASVKGAHSVDASGSTTAATNVENISFTLIPMVSVSPSSGSAETTVTVTGSGFIANESSVAFTYDKKVIKSGITADASGSWSTTFTIPSSAGGSHVLDAYGSSTTAAEVSDASFTIAPSMTIDHNSARVGDNVNVAGKGFIQNEGNIVVTFDGAMMKSGIVANDSGQWSTDFLVPACTGGTHTIDAYGTATAATTVADISISIEARITLSPSIGNVGDTITISGAGFTAGKSVTIIYGASTVLSNIATDSTGNFSGSFKATGGSSGEVKVVATDSAGVTTSTVFAMETGAPSVPQIKSPKAKSTVGFIGDTKIMFDWSDISDPSGISYDLEVSSQSDFTDTIIKHSNLKESQYKSTDEEKLPHGEYYWRVRAVDGAGNASQWTPATMVKAAIMTTTLFVIIIVVEVLVLVAIGLRIRKVFFKH
jgi:hypothetical protein